MTYFFVDEETHLVVKRKHEYNAEVVDGLISLLEPTHQCYLVAHMPTKKFTYECFVKQETDPGRGLRLVDKLGPKDQNEPGYPYYCLVPKERYKKYLDDNNFKEYADFEPKKETKPHLTSRSPDIKKVPGRISDADTSSKETQNKPKPSPVKDYNGVKFYED